jgi:hypothetical protein
MAARSARRLSRAGSGAARRLWCHARVHVHVRAAHLGPRPGEAAVEVVEGDHRVVADRGAGRRLEEVTREPLERVLAVSLVEHLHVHVRV